MSRYFQVDGEVLWNPAARVARLFAETAETLAEIVERPSGIGPAEEDEYEIDLPVFIVFTEHLVRHYARSNHTVMRTLMEGVIVTALGLAGRAGAAVPAVGELDAPDVRALAERGERIERTMPR